MHFVRTLNVIDEWYPAIIVGITEPGGWYMVQFEGYEEEQAHSVSIDCLQHSAPEQELLSPTCGAMRVSLKDSIASTDGMDEGLERLIREDLSVIDNGVQKRKKYQNELMELHAVDEGKLALSVMEEDDVRFAEYAKVSEDEGHEDGDALDAEKYIVVDAEGRKRRINPLNDECGLCARKMALTWHHLIPKCTHNDYLKRHSNATRLYLNQHGTWICRQCHSAIHGLYSNQELMRSYWTVELLLQNDRVQKWIKYISKRKASRHYDRKSKKQNMVAQLSRNKKDQSTKIKYID